MSLTDGILNVLNRESEERNVHVPDAVFQALYAGRSTYLRFGVECEIPTWLADLAGEVWKGALGYDFPTTTQKGGKCSSGTSSSGLAE